MSYYSQDPQQPSYQVPPPMAMQQTSTMAIISLVFGILGLVQVCPGIGSIIALITGYMAKSEIKNDPARYTGDGLAMGGIILGWIGVALMACAICGVILYFTGMLALIGISNNSGSFVPGLLKLVF